MSHTLFYSYTYYWRFYVIGNKHQRNKWESCYADNSWSSNLICDWTYTKLEVKNYGEGVIHVRRNDLAASETDLTLHAKFGWVVIKEKILNQTIIRPFCCYYLTAMFCCAFVEGHARKILVLFQWIWPISFRDVLFHMDTDWAH